MQWRLERFLQPTLKFAVKTTFCQQKQTIVPQFMHDAADRESWKIETIQMQSLFLKTKQS